MRPLPIVAIAVLSLGAAATVKLTLLQVDYTNVPAT